MLKTLLASFFLCSLCMAARAETPDSATVAQPAKRSLVKRMVDGVKDFEGVLKSFRRHLRRRILSFVERRRHLSVARTGELAQMMVGAIFGQQEDERSAERLMRSSSRASTVSTEVRRFMPKCLSPSVSTALPAGSSSENATTRASGV